MATLKYPGLQKYDDEIKSWIANVNSGLVHNSGNEPISGIKDFDESPLVPNVAAGDSSEKAANTAFVTGAIATADNELRIKILDDYYAMQRTGKVYQTRFPLYATATTTAGTKLLDNTGLDCTPSTDSTEGTDDYADIPLFQWVNINYIREDDGTPVPTAIEGSPDYQTSGAVDIGCMQMSFYWAYTTDSDYCYFTISDMPHPELGLVPWYECVRADGTVLPYCIGSKYMAGHGSDGKPRSLPGINLWNRTMSYTTAITNFQAKGAGYWGAGIEADLFQILFFAIKYADKNMQSVMMGCTSYNQTNWVAKAETGVKRLLLPASLTTFKEGTYIQAGTDTVQTDTERGGADHYDICDHAKILSVEQVEIDETTYTALNLDLPANIDTTLGGVVQTTPWNAGATDVVIGKHDGSPVDNSSGIYPYRIQGREYAVGANTVAANVVLNNGDSSETVYCAGRGVSRSTDTAVIAANYASIGPAFINSQQNYYIADISTDDAKGIWWPISAGSGNSVGWCDQVYIRSSGGYASGWRELAWGGTLSYGLGAGPCYWIGYSGLGSAFWLLAARD